MSDMENYNNSEFVTKQRKMYQTTTMSKIGRPHNYRGIIYVMNYFFSSLFKVKVKKWLTKSQKPKNTKFVI